MHRLLVVLLHARACGAKSAKSGGEQIGARTNQPHRCAHQARKHTSSRLRAGRAALTNCANNGKRAARTVKVAAPEVVRGVRVPALHGEPVVLSRLLLVLFHAQTVLITLSKEQAHVSDDARSPVGCSCMREASAGPDLPDVVDAISKPACTPTPKPHASQQNRTTHQRSEAKALVPNRKAKQSRAGTRARPI